MTTLEKFIFTEWHYDCKRTLQLSKQMDPLDQETFYLDIGSLQWDEYFRNTIQGVRQYLSKESPKTLTAARKKDKILLGLHVALQLAFYYGIWKLFICLFGLTAPKAALLLPIFYILMGLI